jgi:hypothetical protein
MDSDPNTSVSDLHWVYADPDTDPDLAFLTNADQDADPDSGKIWTKFS